MAAADRLNGALARGFLRIIEKLRDALPIDKLALALLVRDRRAIDEALSLSGIAPAMQTILADFLGRATAAGAAAAQPTLLGIGVRYDLVNQVAVQWADQYAATLVVQIGDEARHAIREAVARGYQNGTSPDRLARQLCAVLGLTDRQAAAVDRLRQTALAGGTSQKRVDALADQYAQRLLRQRAVLVSRTELMTAANRGQQLLWERAKADGSIGMEYEREWLSTDQKNTCDQCRALGGARAPIGGYYHDGGGSGPPRHAACRCTEVLVKREGWA